MCTQFAVGHDKTLHFTCNQHTNMQAPTTVACILQKNYGTTTCSQANAHNHNPALHYSADQCSTRPLTKSRSFQRQPHHRQAAHPNSSSKAHAILLTKRIMHVKLLAYILNSVWIHYVMVHSSSGYPSSSYSSSTYPCLWHPHPLHATELTLQDLHTPPYMPCPVQSIGICF